MLHRLPVLFLFCLLSGPFYLDVNGFAESSPEQLQSPEQVTLEAELVASGSTLLSIPLDLDNLDVGAWLVASGISSKGVHGWDARAQKYVPLKTVLPGQGFLLARGPGKLPVSGQRVIAEVVEIPLFKGWNLIGVPFEGGLPLAKLRIALDGNTENFLVAAEKNWVGGVSALVDGKSASLSAETAQLEPWRGYWLYAYQPCQLIFPALEKETKIQGKKRKR